MPSAFSFAKGRRMGFGLFRFARTTGSNPYSFSSFPLDASLLNCTELSSCSLTYKVMTYFSLYFIQSFSYTNCNIYLLNYCCQCVEYTIFFRISIPEHSLETSLILFQNYVFTNTQGFRLWKKSRENPTLTYLILIGVAWLSGLRSRGVEWKFSCWVPQKHFQPITFTM